ncbi:mycobactin polyketide synthase MbtD [Mycobacterium sp. SP-6446]|uniref:mycobactin polyketide synthase MbtD n=1 Tax=Mycobacterium sp. SP-6446 TaxID=1834162 RepID=UPI00096FBAD7|nr:mycobactin polyketide synthase MbtD [Mycobacterium sp. SP-6446]OMC16195.1 polyketide synthase [Mycobacterium sp. SP-6446]
MLTHPLPDGRVPVLLSAHDEKLIGQDARAVLDYLDRVRDHDDLTTAVASTLLRLRRVRRHRVVARAADRGELAAVLSALARGDEHPLVARSSKGGATSIAFVFPGQGNQWQSMGAVAYQRLPAYRAEADRCARAFVDAGLPSPLPYLTEVLEGQWSRTHIQGAQFTHAVSLARQWRSHGVLPDITIGHSLGEVAAAYVAGSLSLPDAVTLVGARAAIVGRLPGRYAMAVLGVGLDEAESVIGETPGWLEVSAVNGPLSTVVAGDHDAVVGAVRLAQQRGMFAHQLSVDYPGHTSILRLLRAELAELVPGSAFQQGPVAFVGSTFGTEVGGDTNFGEYWYENLCSTVRFDQAVTAAQKLGANTFVELSAHPSLLYPLMGLVEQDSAVVVGSGHRDESIIDQLSANVAAVAIADPGCHWVDTIPGGIRPPLRGFPNAPMRAIHLWVAPEALADDVSKPTADLTIAVEDWQYAVAPPTQNTPPSAIAIVGDTAGMLTEAVMAHRDCRVVPANEAEIIAVIAPALETLDVVAAIEDIAGLADVGLPDYAMLIGSRCRAVWLLTAGAERVRPDDPDVRPAQAALAAMHRSVGFEFPDQTFGNLDLPSRNVDAATAAAVVGVLRGDATVAALRDNGVGGSCDGTRVNGAARNDMSPRCYVRTFRERRGSAAKRPVHAAELENVVITGGSGAIGLRYARYCIEQGARTVVLLSRNGVDPRVLDQLASRHDVEVHAPRCDITDRAALSAVAAKYAGSGASLVIHTAGIAMTRQRSELTGVDIAAVCAAKVAGLALLADTWPLRPDSRILACSSVFGVWGGHGHAAYAASNRMLDVLAAQMRASGRDCAAIRWGLWQSAGVVGEWEITRTQRSGLRAMEPDAALDAGMAGHAEDPLIFTADFDRLRVFFESQGIPMPFGAPPNVDGASSGNGSDSKPLAETVCTELAATLHLGDSESIDLGASLVDLGLDSLLALDLRKRLRRTVGRSAPVARMLGGITVGELIKVLRSGSAGGPIAPPTSERASVAGTAQLSAFNTPERLEPTRD